MASGSSPKKLGRSGVPGGHCMMVLNHYAPNRRDTGSTSPRSVGEVALIRHTISHYSPVLIAPLSNQLPRAGVQKKKSAWRLVVATLRYLAFGSRAGPPVSIK